VARRLIAGVVVLAALVSACGSGAGSGDAAPKDAVEIESAGERTVSGTFYVDGKEAGSFSLKPDGSFSFVLERSGVRADRSNGSAEIVSSDLVVRNTGLPLAGPDSNAFGNSWDVRVRESQLKVFPIEDTGDTGTPTTYAGRDAFEVGDEEPRQGEPLVRMIIDAETGLPLRASYEYPGRPTRVVEVRDLTFGAASSELPTITTGNEQATAANPGAFELETPGARTTGLSYDPLVLDEPLGFRAVMQQVHRGLVPGGSVGNGPQPELGEAKPLNPASHDVRITAYRRDFREIVLTTRSASPPGAAQTWGDLYEFWTKPDIDEDVLVDAGAANGTTFRIVSGIGIVTHAWGVVGDQVVTIGGDVSVAELRSLLSQLRRQDPA
jgi:hypothetical protein